MSTHKHELILLPGRYAICRLDPNSPLPDMPRNGFWSVTRTADELSLVCDEDSTPPATRIERDWRCIRVAGSMDFSTIGVVAGLTSPLAAAGISVFVLSTFDTDYLFVKEKDLERAIAALREAGFRLSTSNDQNLI